MPKCLFEKATALYVSGTMHDDLPHDPGTHVQLVLQTYPDRRLHRWNGALGIRNATAQELSDFDSAEIQSRDSIELAEIDKKLMRAVLIYLVKRLNELRTQPTTAFPALTAADVRSGIIAEYQNL